MRIVVMLFFLASLFAAPLHALEGHCAAPVCTDGLPVTHFDAAPAPEIDGCFFCTHSPNPGLFDGFFVQPFLPASCSGESIADAGQIASFLEHLPLSRAPPGTGF